MKRILKICYHIIELMLIIGCAIMFIQYTQSGRDNLDYGIQRITNLTGYEIDKNLAALILHKSNMSDSVVMIEDHRSAETITEQMTELVETDYRWTSVHIAEEDAYDLIHQFFSASYQTSQHFRPVCEIQKGYYDFMYYERNKGSIYGCLIDVETGTIALYIYLD